MKSSKSKSRKKDKSRRSSSRDKHPRKYRSRSSSSEKEYKSRRSSKKPKIRHEPKWESPEEEEIPPKVETASAQIEKNPPPEAKAPSKIQTLLDDKEKIIEYLFLAISGIQLEELIPPFLKKYSIGDLKKRCLEELNKMSKDKILYIISGKDPLLYVEKDSANPKPETAQDNDADGSKETQEIMAKGIEVPAKSVLDVSRLPVVTNRPSPAGSDLSCDALELYPSSKEIESIDEEENQIPLVENEEIIKQLVDVDIDDLELLELEMRARAIRSLLKAKGIPASEDENSKEKE